MLFRSNKKTIGYQLTDGTGVTEYTNVREISPNNVYSEWVKYDYLMSPTQIIEKFGSELEDKDIDDIYEYWYGNYSSEEDLFAIKERQDLYQSYQNQIVVTHFSWKALRKVGFLTYMDENGEEQMKLVSEIYKLDKSIGDIDIEWE